MRSMLSVTQRAYPQILYQLIMSAQAADRQAWQPSILLAALAPQPP
jgi:hypothetical protein